jgi:hypothetical protein
VQPSSNVTSTANHQSILQLPLYEAITCKAEHCSKSMVKYYQLKASPLTLPKTTLLKDKTLSEHQMAKL